MIDDDPYQKSPVPIYVVMEGDVLLEAAPAEAWPLIMDFPSWQNFAGVDHVLGPVGMEGELVLLKKDEPGAGKSPYFARTVKLDPVSTVIWKIYREVHAQGDANLGIVQFSVAAEGAQTRFSYRVLYEFDVPKCSQAQWQQLRNTYHGNVRTLLSGVMPKLQALVKSKVSRKRPE